MHDLWSTCLFQLIVPVTVGVDRITCVRNNHKKINGKVQKVIDCSVEDNDLQTFL